MPSNSFLGRVAPLIFSLLIVAGSFFISAEFPTGFQTKSDNFTVSTGIVTSDSIEIKWGEYNDGVNRVGSYGVEYKKSSDTAWISDKNVTERHIKIERLKADTSYDFRVTAFSEAKKQQTAQLLKVSSVLTAKTLKQELKFTINTVTENSISLSWGSYPGADSYRIEKNQGSSDWKVEKETANVSYTISNLERGTSYSIRIHALSGGTILQTSRERGVETAGGLKVAANTPTYSSIPILWSNYSGADSYVIEVRTSGSDVEWSKVAYVRDYIPKSYVLTNLLPETSYQIHVHAGIGSNIIKTSNEIWVKTAAQDFKVSNGTSSQTEIPLNWNFYQGADKYYVVYKKSSMTNWIYNQKYFITDRSNIITGLERDSSYDVKVEARKADGYILKTSNILTVKTDAVPALILSISEAADTALTPSWNNVSGAASYNVRYKTTGANSWAGIIDAKSKNIYTISGLIPDTSYDIKAEAIASGQIIKTSNLLVVKTFPQNLTLKAGTTTSATIALGWNRVYGTSYYKAEYKKSGTSQWGFAPYVNGAEYSTTLFNLEPSTSYDIRLNAIDPYDKVLKTSSTITAKTSAYTAIELQIATESTTESSISLLWNSYPDASSYSVKNKKTGEPSWASSATVTGIYYTVAGLEPGISYDIEVGAIKNGVYLKQSIITAKTLSTSSAQPSDQSQSSGSSPDQIGSQGSSEPITPKASFRKDDWVLTESKDGALEGVKEGDLVWFEPVGNVSGKKVEWFDEWNGKKYKIIMPLPFRSYVVRIPSMKIEASKDKNYISPAMNVKAGDKLYLRTNSSGYSEGIIYLSASYTRRDGSAVKIGSDFFGSGIGEREFIIPEDFDRNFSLYFTFDDGDKIENISITLPIDGSSISRESLGRLLIKNNYKKELTALGIDKEITRVFDSDGIYRYFAEGEHNISMAVDGEYKGKIKINVAEWSAQKTIKVGVVLALYDNIKPIRCGDGRDRDGDGFTGYGENDDCDGWDKYEYENILFSRTNKYYHEASNGRVGFTWKIFDNNGKWVYVAQNPLHGASVGLIPLLVADAIEAATGETRGSFTGTEGKIIVVLPRDGAAGKIMEMGYGFTGFDGDMLIREYSSMGVPSHELGHSLGQTMELYPASLAGQPTLFGESNIRSWGVMYSTYELGDNFPPLMDAFTRIKAGWSSEDVKLKDGKYSLQQANKANKVLTTRATPILSYIIGTRYFVEARTRNPALTYFDRGAPDTAVVVYKVNTLASGIDQITIAGTLKNNGDIIDEGMTNAQFMLTKNNLDVDGSAEVEIKTKFMSNMIGAVSDAAGQAGEAAQNAGEAIADSAGDAADSVSNFVGGLFGGASGPASNEKADLDLHAYYSLNGKQYHIGMDYKTGKYETQQNTISSGDLGVGEYIFVPDTAKDLQFKVVNKKLKDYFAKHPESVKQSDGTEKFSITFVKYDAQGKRTLTNPQKGSIKLSDSEKVFSLPATGFLDTQTTSHIAAEDVNNRLTILRKNKGGKDVIGKIVEGVLDVLGANRYDIVFSENFTGKNPPQPPESIFGDKYKYVVVLQRAGSDNELYINDDLLKQDVRRFADAARKQKDNSVRIMNLNLRDKPSKTKR